MSELISEKNKHTIKCDCGIDHVLTPEGEKILLESIVKKVKPKKVKNEEDEVNPELPEPLETVKPKSNNWLFDYE